MAELATRARARQARRALELVGLAFLCAIGGAAAAFPYARADLATGVRRSAVLRWACRAATLGQGLLWILPPAASNA
ncbi:MAG: hypothetical protein HYZ53_14990 [Planctomycetes bacterium]|nr:hypothetical protein [Planctomycetota bacterium]